MAELPLSHLTVLVIEDDPDNLELHAVMLESAGATPIMAMSVADAFVVLDAQPVDAVLCDISMPGENGFDFIRALRERDAAAGGQVPVVAVTSHVGSDQRRLVLAAGFSEHLGKPLDLEALVRTVRALVPPPPPPTG